MSGQASEPSGRGDARLRPVWFWLTVLGAVFVAFYLFRAVLLPFVAGAAIAYFLDPLTDRLERLRLPRALAAILVILLFFALALTVLLLFVPLLQKQIGLLFQNLPTYAETLRGQADVLWIKIQTRAGVPVEEQRTLSDAVGGMPDVGRALRWAGQIFGEVLSGGLAVFNLLSLLFITPVVAFYLLRDWDRMTAMLDSLIPRGVLPTVRGQLAEIDRTLSGFARGQILLCLTLGSFYAIGLSLAGLEFGLIIGILAGLLAFIPFVGTWTGAILSIGLAFAQFDDPVRIAIIAGVFAAGQALEGNVLQPMLVGDRVGLHAVWVIFALLAGGSLFGFVGILLAVPVAAVLGVLVRFGVQKYRQSHLYADPAP